MKFLGFIPHAGSVQYGAPDPPEKRDHYGVSDFASVRSQETYNVLMRVHVDPKSIFLALAQDADNIVHKVIVKDTTVELSVSSAL